MLLWAFHAKVSEYLNVFTKRFPFPKLHFFAEFFNCVGHLLISFLYVLTNGHLQIKSFLSLLLHKWGYSLLPERGTYDLRKGGTFWRKLTSLEGWWRGGTCCHFRSGALIFWHQAHFFKFHDLPSLTFTTIPTCFVVYLLYNSA